MRAGIAVSLRTVGPGRRPEVPGGFDLRRASVVSYRRSLSLSPFLDLKKSAERAVNL